MQKKRTNSNPTIQEVKKLIELGLTVTDPTPGVVEVLKEEYPNLVDVMKWDYDANRYYRLVSLATLPHPVDAEPVTMAYVKPVTK